MLYFIKANDKELGTATYVFDNQEEMLKAWNNLDDDVEVVWISKNGIKSILFERCF